MLLPGGFFMQISRRELAGAVVLAGLLLAGLVLRFLFLPQPQELEVKPPQPPAEEEKEPEVIIVHVAGAVRKPGVYSLPEGARVLDAIEAAGGALEEANEHALNLAQPLYDGQRISVPSGSGKEEESTAQADGKININTAGIDELDRLPGIGPAKAAAIISYREKNGPFRDLSELANVSGIGPHTLETLREHVTLY